MRQELSDALERDFPGLVPPEIEGYPGDGWEPLIRTMLEDLAQIPGVGRITQIKEKFGILRVYLSDGDGPAWDAVDRAEIASRKVCEMCGSRGFMRTGGWWKTLCDDCEDKRKTR